MLRKPHAILLAIVALGVLVLLALPESARSRLRLAFGRLFLPLFGLVGSAQGTVDRAAVSLTPRTVLAARLTALEKDNLALRAAVVEAQALARENDRLRQLVGQPQRQAWRLKTARVIGRDPANWWQSVHLDVGVRHGVTTNLAVFTTQGLVGRVAEAGAWTCRVVLVGDPNCPVAAALADSGETGIIRGASGGDIEAALVDLSYLSRNAVAKPGQRVLTSGQGGVFPAGITVGEVVDARMVGAGVYLEARVRLSANLGSLDYVWVKLP
jgi:rod shape-determining protein MreC